LYFRLRPGAETCVTRPANGDGDETIGKRSREMNGGRAALKSGMQPVLLVMTHSCNIRSTNQRSFGRHFLAEHDLSGSIRQAIQAYASQYTITEASELVYWTERVQPIPYLKIIDGFECVYDGCGEVLGTLESMKRHCRMVHEWKGSRDGERWVETQAQKTKERHNDHQKRLIVHSRLAWREGKNEKKGRSGTVHKTCRVKIISWQNEIP
jgi:hypothetical protein